MSESNAVNIPGLDALLSGYDIFGEYANWNSHKATLFEKSELEDVTFRGDHGDVTFSKPRWVAYGEVKAAKVRSESAESIQEYASRLSSRTDVKGAYGAFKGELGVEFSKDETQMTSRAYTAFEVLIIKWDLSMPNADLRQYLTAQARKDIDDASKSPDEVLDTYGTHFVRSLRVGGTASRYSSTDTTKFTSTSDLEIAAKMSYKNSAGKLSAEEKAEYGTTVSKFDSASKTEALARGGDSGLATRVFQGEFDAWSASVEVSPVFVDFPPDDALEGIWTLASTKARQDSLKAAFDRLVNEQFAVKYGDDGYLEVAGRYLDGGRGDHNASVDTKGYVAAEDTCFRWIFTRVSGKDEFLRYGDTVKIRVKTRDDRWLTGGRGNGNEHVYTRDPKAETSEATYKWKIQKDRTTVGSGPVLYGESTIYLQVQSCGHWLSGGRGDGNRSVVTRDGENGLAERNYQWTVKRKPV
jgi:hypothetical protein